MLPQPQIHIHNATHSKSPGPPIEPPRWYIAIPRRLLTDLHDTPLAIGMYALIARLYVIVREPVPLSRADVLRYDPSLKPGAVKRAFDRLIAGGWLVHTQPAGTRKHAYTPTWGRVKGAPLAWDLQDACHGRPRHIQRLMLDRNVFDICMGKLTPHPSLQATITRYMTAPALSLSDVGCYALTLADIVRPTPNLRWLGLIHNEQVRPLPSEQRLLAIISQRALTLDDERPARDTEITLSGARRLGLAPLVAQNPHDSAAQPLFFVPPDLIGSLIGPLIGSLIGPGEEAVDEQAASASDEIRSDVRPTGITWESLESKDLEIPPQPPTTPPAHAGGGERTEPDQGRRARPGGRRPEVVPENETTRLLRTINVLPEQLIELSTMPMATVQAAIDDGKARPGIRDLAGWVVKLLRTHRDYGWKIGPPAPRTDSPEALRAAFARYAVEQEAACREGLPDDQPWFPPPTPEPLHLSGATIRLWNHVQAAIKTQISRTEFNTWIRRTSLYSLERSVATIMAPNTLVKQAIEDRYLGMLRGLLCMYAGEALDVRVILNPSAPAEILPETSLPLVTSDSPAATASGAPACTPPETAAPPSAEGCPAWIAAERWAVLPVMLRAALAGSELVDGEVRGRVPYLTGLLRTRYAREVDALIAASSP